MWALFQLATKRVVFSAVLSSRSPRGVPHGRRAGMDRRSRAVTMAPSQRSAENFNKKLAAKAKRGIVASGAVDADGKNREPERSQAERASVPATSDRLFKQQDELKQHVARRATPRRWRKPPPRPRLVPPKGDGDEGAGSSKPTKPPPGAPRRRGMERPASGDGFPCHHEGPQDDSAGVHLEEEGREEATVRHEGGARRRGWTGWRSHRVDVQGGAARQVQAGQGRRDFLRRAVRSKEEAAQRAAVAALAKVASNLPNQRLLPAKYKARVPGPRGEPRARPRSAADAEERERPPSKPQGARAAGAAHERGEAEPGRGFVAGSARRSGCGGGQRGRAGHPRTPDEARSASAAPPRRR